MVGEGGEIGDITPPSNTSSGPGRTALPCGVAAWEAVGVVVVDGCVGAAFRGGGPDGV